MKRRIILLLALIVLSVCIWLAFISPRLQSTAQTDLPPEIVAASERFKAQPGNRVPEARILRPYLKPAMTKQQTEALLGETDQQSTTSQSVYYSATRSLGITIYFDENDNVIHVESIDDNYSSGIARAWPLLHTGMTRSEITVQLGEAQKELDDGRVWHYIPRNSPTIFIVTFDANDKVEKLETTDSNIK